MRMTQPFRGTVAAIALGAAIVLATAVPANAAVTVTLSPTTGAVGTRVDVLASNCDHTATAVVENTDVSLRLPKNNDNAQGYFTVPEGMEAGTYSVTVTCGKDTAAAPFTVASGEGARTGGGSAASESAAAIMLSGAAVVAAAAVGLWLLRRRDKVSAT